MSLDAKSLWRTFRKQGPRACAVALATGLLWLGINKLLIAGGQRAVEVAHEAIAGPPTFLVDVQPSITLTEALITKGEEPSGTAVETKIVTTGRIQVIGGPGIYSYKFLGADGRAVTGIFELGENVHLATISIPDSDWVSADQAERIERSSAALSRVRTAVSPLDEAISVSIESKTEKAILSTALHEVGVSESDKQRLNDYWRASRSHPFPDAWGGAFLAYTLKGTGVLPPPPNLVLSYPNWAHWGSNAGSLLPGTIAVFALGPNEVAPAKSRTIVGVVLRTSKECTDIITANVLNKVVIACVIGEPLAIRHPAPSTESTE